MRIYTRSNHLNKSALKWIEAFKKVMSQEVEERFEIIMEKHKLGSTTARTYIIKTTFAQSQRNDITMTSISK